MIIATRHIITTEIKSGFSKHYDLFLSVDFFTGPKNNICSNFLNPIAFNTIADFVYHIRHDISGTLICDIFRRLNSAFFDDSQPISVQLMIIKLYINLIESFFKENNDITICIEIINKVIPVFLNKIKDIRKFFLIPSYQDVFESSDSNKLELHSRSINESPEIPLKGLLFLSF